ncbi:MAG TPA: hypothetical protein VJ835_00565 [Fimbriimonadaceae bacterium]|nr:hypothetical protein [Fimbriimonadaceae bacterium]
MASDNFRRTDPAFAKVWLRLPGTALPQTSEIVSSLDPDTVLDPSANLSLWGQLLKGSPIPVLVRGQSDIELAPDEETAYNLVLGHIIQAISALQRQTLDFYVLRVRKQLQEFQISGALRAASEAKAEGHIRFIGLEAAGPASAAQAVWQFHNAFDLVLLSEPDEALEALALERGVELVTQYPSSHCSITPLEYLDVAKVER